MKPLLFAILLSLALSTALAAQSRGTNGTGSLSGDVSGAFSRMEDAFAKTDDDVSPEDAYYLGRAVAANILTRYRLYTSKPALTRYLNQICAAITINSPMP